MYEGPANHRAPAIYEKWQRELTKLGGLNPFGEPNLRIVWGQTEQKWIRGRWRTKYRDYRWPVQVTQIPTRVGDNDQGKREVRAYRDIDAAMDADWPGSTFLLYHEYEWVGRPNWVIEQWYPITYYKGESEERWEALRYKDIYDEELGYDSHCDMLGPFPRRGVYDAIIFVGRHVGNTYSGRALLDYREMSDDVMEEIRQKYHAREHTHDTRTVEQIADQMINDLDVAEKKVDDLDILERQELARDVYHVVAKDRTFLTGVEVPK